MTTRSIEPNSFRLKPAPCLIGGRHRVSGHIAFPLPQDPGNFEPIDFPSSGTLWSFTVQRIAPKSPPYRGPVPFEPFAVGYVELTGAVIVESRLVGIEFSRLRIGLPVTLATLPLYRDEDGTEVLAFAFTTRTDQTS